ncbi:MAG: type III pantothenate kinase [Candidatus Kapaibacteriota bacterium]
MAIQLDIISINGLISTLIAVDIGNSAIKFFSNNNLFNYSYKSDWEKEVRHFIGGLSNQSVCFIISSVNREKYQYLLSLLESNIFHQHFDINILLEKQNIINFNKIYGIGNDRKLGLIGALTYSDPPFITIDLGTATTINFLDENYICQGGAIIPGIFTQLRSLIEHTSALKRIRLEDPKELLGKSTNEAISSGIVNGTIGAIELFINKIRSQYQKQKIKVFVTGGNSLWIYEQLANQNEHIELKHYLVLEGIIKLAKKYL